MKDTSSSFRASKLTPGELDDAKRLDARFAALKATNGMTKAQFAKEFKVPGGASMISQNTSGTRPISLAQAKAYMLGFGCTLEEISPALAAQLPAKSQESSEEDFADVVHLDVSVAAGHGSVPHFEEELGTLKFRRDFLKSIGVSEAKAVVVTAKGASMEPTIPDGSVLLVNRANREPRANAIYVFHLRGNGLVVKRVVKSNGQWVARSDNDDRDAFPDFAFDEGATLIGRAVWVGSKL